jgi:hypothetical protein
MGIRTQMDFRPASDSTKLHYSASHIWTAHLVASGAGVPQALYSSLSVVSCRVVSSERHGVWVIGRGQCAFADFGMPPVE